MAAPQIMVLRVPGTTGDRETKFALESVGAKVTVMPLDGMAKRNNPLDGFQAMVLPGGSSHSDSFSPGRMWALELNRIIYPKLDAFLSSGGMVLGTGNGFQALIHAGWLPEAMPRDPNDRDVTVLQNKSGRFESLWLRCRTPETTKCPLFKPGELWELPLACGWGRLVERTPGRMNQWLAAGHVVLCYAGIEGRTDHDPEDADPTGSVSAVAGFCDRTGRIAGIMPSPERFLRVENHPLWARRHRNGEGGGIQIYRRLVEAVKNGD